MPLPQGFEIDSNVAPQGFQLQPSALPETAVAEPEISPFPEARGQTRAAQELPELGEQGLLSGENVAKAAAVAPALLTATQPEEIAQILTSNFPNIGISQDPGGNLLATNNRTGKQVIINRPGASKLDFLQGLGIGSAFFPSGLGLRAGISGLGQLAGRSAATQAGIEGAQALSGGEFDPEEVSIAGVTAPIGQVVSEKVLSPAARAVGGRVSQAAKELIDEGRRRGVRVLTTDLAPPETFLGKGLQQISEKLGPLGTGSIRANQQRARVEIVERLANEIGASVDNTVDAADIVSNLEKGVARRLQRAGVVRREAIDALKGQGDVDVSKTASTIDRLISDQKKLRGQADQGLISKLEGLKRDIQGADFELLTDFRTSLFEDIQEIQRGQVLTDRAAVPIMKVRSALSDDMNSFARSVDRNAANKWIRSNRMFADNLQKAKETEIGRILRKGTETPEKVGQILRSGKLSEMKRIRSLLSNEGRNSARVAILRDALEESGFFAGNANPDRFATALSKPSRQRAVSAFFNKEQKKEIDGVRKLLEATRRAQQAKSGTTTGLGEASAVVAPAAVAQLVSGDPLLMGLFGSTIVGAAKGYESSAVRNLLLRLASAPKGSQAERKILDRVVPGVVSAIQATRQQVGSE